MKEEERRKVVVKKNHALARSGEEPTGQAQIRTPYHPSMTVCRSDDRNKYPLL
jgi:hypothetical protein